MPVSKKLRIVHCFRAPVGGIFRHVRDLAEAQAAAGHEVGIVCDSTTGGEFEALLLEEMKGALALGVRRTVMQRHVGLGDIASAWKIFRVIKDMQPDVLHGHGAKGGVYARLFGSLLRVFRYRVARLYSPHGGSLHYEQGTPTGTFFFMLERMMIRFTDHLLFVSRYERDTFRRKIAEPRAPNSLVYNGLRLSEFEAVTAPEGAADLLYIGTMRHLKGPGVFIDAMAIAERELGRSITAVMAGDGDERPIYEAQADRLGLAGRIRFVPPMPAREAFSLARTVVVPSRAEAMPYIVLEALAAGKAMIASDVGGIPEIFGAASSVLVRPEPEQIAGKMAEAVRDGPAFALTMPDRATLRARFGADVMAKRIEEAYFAALERRGRRDFHPAASARKS